MAAVIPIAVTPEAVDALWSRYQRLAIDYADIPELRTNRKHIMEMATAERDFRNAALALADKEARTTQ